MSRFLAKTQVEISPIPEWIDAEVLAAGEAGTITVPTGARSVLITVTSPVWFRVASGVIVAAIVVADMDDGKGSLYLSGTALFRVAPGDVLTFFAPAAAGSIVSCGWFGLNAPVVVGA